MASDKHGGELCDDIVSRIDVALSGYETQHAGDDWYGERMFLPGEALERTSSWASGRIEWGFDFSALADAFDRIYTAFSDFVWFYESGDVFVYGQNAFTSRLELWWLLRHATEDEYDARGDRVDKLIEEIPMVDRVD